MKKLRSEALNYYNKNVVEMIMEKYGYDEFEAIQEFILSKTHDMLEDPKYGLQEFGPPGIFDMWEAEKVTGDPRNSIYIRG